MNKDDALEKKAENARELGLNYEPEQEPVAFAKIFTQLKTDDEPCNEVIALGHMMRDWLQKQVSDNSSYVDTGKGFSEYNLWVMCEGKELLISIKESK